MHTHRLDTATTRTIHRARRLCFLLAVFTCSCETSTERAADPIPPRQQTTDSTPGTAMKPTPPASRKPDHVTTLATLADVAPDEISDTALIKLDGAPALFLARVSPDDAESYFAVMHILEAPQRVRKFEVNDAWTSGVFDAAKEGPISTVRRRGGDFSTSEMKDPMLAIWTHAVSGSVKYTAPSDEHQVDGESKTETLWLFDVRAGLSQSLSYPSSRTYASGHGGYTSSNFRVTRGRDGMQLRATHQDKLTKRRRRERRPQSYPVIFARTSSGWKKLHVEHPPYR